MKGTFNGPSGSKSPRGAIFQDSPGSGGDCGRRNQLGLEMGRRERRRSCDAQHPLAGALCGERFEEEPGREGGLGQAVGQETPRREGTNVLPSWEKAIPRGPFCQSVNIK